MKNEESKQRAKNYMSLKRALEHKQIKCYCGHTTMCDCSPIDEAKQETLEEVAKKYAENKSSAEVFQEAHIIDFKAGAKWMQERSYIEANKIIEFLDNEAKLKISDTKTIERIKWYFETYFKQFKKK